MSQNASAEPKCPSGHRPAGHDRARPPARLLPRGPRRGRGPRRARRQRGPARCATCGTSRGRRSTTTTRATSTSSRSPSRSPAGAVKILVAIADVDASCATGTAIDGHARTNTTSVYTAAEIFPMLPEKLSTDLTSLGEDEDRLAVVVEMMVGADGSVTASDVYRALVRNHAKLAYNAVAAWLDGTGQRRRGRRRRARARRAAAPAGPRRAGAEGAAPPARRPEPRDHRGAGRLRRRRARRPAAGREEPRQGADRGPHDRGERRDRAFLEASGFPSLRRVLRTPERWDRIVELAAGARRAAARGAERRGAPGVPRCAGASRSRALPRPVALRRQAAGLGRIRGRVPGRPARATSASRSGTTRTPPRPTAASPTSSPSACSRPRSPGAPSRTRRRARGARPPLHRAGGQRGQGRAAGAQVRGGAAARLARSASASTRSSPAPRRRGRGCASSIPPSRARWCAAQGLDVGDRVRVELVRHRRRARLHRLRARLTGSARPSARGRRTSRRTRARPAPACARRLRHCAVRFWVEADLCRCFVACFFFSSWSSGCPCAEAGASTGCPAPSVPARRLQQSPMRGGVPAAKASSRSPGKTRRSELRRNGKPKKRTRKRKSTQ